MDHAEAFERLQDASTEPGRLRAIDTDNSVEGRQLRDHLEICEPCRIELRALRLTDLALAAAAPDTMRAPVEARSRVLAAVAATGVARGREISRPAAVPPPSTAAPGDATGRVPSPVGRVPAQHTPSAPATESVLAGSVAAESAAVRTLPPVEPPITLGRRRESGLRFRWLALAAAAAVLVFVGGALFGGVLGLTQPPEPPRGLLAVVNATDDILQRPGHVQLVLQTVDGRSGGSMLLDPASERIVVLSQALQPVPGTRYGCFVVRDGKRTWIGPMFFDSGTAYWAGRSTAVPDLGRPGDILEVRLQELTGMPALSATFTG